MESIANVSKINEPSNSGANCPVSIISFSGDVIENLIFSPAFGSKLSAGMLPVITTLFPFSYMGLFDLMLNSDSLFSEIIGFSAISSDFSIIFGNVSNVNGKTLRFTM